MCNCDVTSLIAQHLPQKAAKGQNDEEHKKRAVVVVGVGKFFFVTFFFALLTSFYTLAIYNDNN